MAWELPLCMMAHRVFNQDISIGVVRCAEEVNREKKKQKSVEIRGRRETFSMGEKHTFHDKMLKEGKLCGLEIGGGKKPFSALTCLEFVAQIYLFSLDTKSERKCLFPLNFREGKNILARSFPSKGDFFPTIFANCFFSLVGRGQEKKIMAIR